MMSHLVQPAKRNFDVMDIGAVEAFWDRRPCNLRHSRQPVGTRVYFDEVERRKYFVEPHIRRFAQFERWAGRRVLEIGCGIGTDTINFCRAGAYVTAVDLSEVSLDIARRRADVFGVADRVSFHKANAEELSSALGTLEPFDLVYSFGVIHHTPNPARVIQQVRSFVHSGSAVKVMVYHRFSWKVLWILATYGRGQIWRSKELIARYSEAESGCPVTYTYSQSEARMLLESAGYLRVAEAWVDHIFPYHIPDYVNHRYVKEWYWRALPEPVFRWLEQHIGWHLCLTGEVL